MAKHKPGINPFYLLLVVVGIAFCLSACAYTVLTVREIRGDLVLTTSSSGLMGFMDQYGAPLLGGEVLLMMVTSAAAMLTDRRWSNRSAASDAASRPENRTAEAAANIQERTPS